MGGDRDVRTIASTDRRDRRDVVIDRFRTASERMASGE